jgi:putative spermidine/putrescine transport system permease protein
VGSNDSPPKAGRVRSVEHVVGLLLLIVIVTLPVVWIIGYSALYSLGVIGRFRSGLTFMHWREAFAGQRVGISIVYSSLVAGVVVGLSTLLSLGLTMLLRRHRNDRRVLVALSIPMATPVVVIAFLVYQIFNPGGMLSRLAFHVGVIESPTDFPTLVNDVWSLGIVMAGLFGVVPLLTIFFLNAWSVTKVDRFLLLAESLGANRWQSRMMIIVPMLLNRGRSVILLMFLIQFGSYEVPLLLGRQSPQMMSVLTQRRFGQFDLSQRPQAFVIATAYLMLVGAGVVLLRQMRRRHEA